MRKLLPLLLCFAAGASAKEFSYRLEPPRIPASKIVEAVPPPQTHVFAALDVNNAFTGNNTHSGTETFTGGITATTGANTFNCKSFEGTACVDNANSGGWTGTDACAWINSAQAILPTIGGIVDARGLSGTQVCSGGIAVGSTTKEATLLLGPVKLVITAQATIEQGSTIKGTQPGSGAPSGITPSVIQANSTFPAATTLLKLNPTSTTSTGTKIEDIQLNGNDIATTCLDTNNAQEMTTINRVAIVSCLTADISVTGSSQNIGIYDSIGYSSSAAGGNAHSSVVLSNGADSVTLINYGCTRYLGGSQTTGACVLGTATNFYVNGIHCEYHADCISVSGAGSSSVSAIGLNGLSSVTNMLHISSTFGGAVHAAAIRKFTATNAVKNDNANFNGAAQNSGLCTSENVAVYDFNASTAPTTLITDCPLTPSKLPKGLMIGTFQGIPDATTTLELTADSTVDTELEFNDTNGTNPRKVVLGPGVGGTNRMALRDFTGSKQLMEWQYNTGNNVVFPQGIAQFTEVAAPSGVASSDLCYGDSTAHALECSYNNGTFGVVPLLNRVQTWTAAQTHTGAAIIPDQTSGITGTTTNNNVNAGGVGEYVQSVLATGSSVTLATGVTSNVTSISLTAGDWDVTGAVDFTFGATTSYTNLIGSVSTTTGTIGGQDSKFDFETPAAVPTAGADSTFPLPVVRFSLASTTTVFLVAQGTFTVSTLKAYGTIRARRIR